MLQASGAPLVLALAAVVASCTATAPAAPGGQSRTANEEAIRGRVARYETALNERDAAAIASLYSADGDLVYFDEARVVGLDAIQHTLESSLPELPAGLHATLTVTSIRFPSPDVAIVETAATFSEGPSNRGTTVLVRDGGEWRHSALRIYPAERAR